MKNWKIILAILTANVFFMSASYTMLIPFLPMYLLRELGVQQADVTMWSGAIFSVTFLIGGIMAPIWGRLADKKGKKLMAIRSGLGLSLAYFLGGIVTSPEQMFCVRVFQGFAAGLWSVCLAIATSSVPMNKLGMSLGILQSGLTSGNVIGPLIGGMLASLFGMRTSFYLAGFFLLMISIIFYFYIPEPPRSEPASVPSRAVEQEKDSALLKRPAIMEALLYAALVQMVVLLIQPVLSLYIAQFDPNMDNIVFMSGLIFSLFGISSAMTAPFWGRFGQRRGFYISLSLAALLSGVMMVMLSLPKTLLLFATLYFGVGLFFAGLAPSISAILVANTDQSHRGRIFGFMFSAQQFGSMTGPLIGGAVATLFSMNSVFVLAGIVLLMISIAGCARHWHYRSVMEKLVKGK